VQEMCISSDTELTGAFHTAAEKFGTDNFGYMIRGAVTGQNSKKKNQ